MSVEDYTIEAVGIDRRPEKPKVSIVIPVMNQLAMTMDCLVSIEQHTDPEDYELIIINNGSTDGTREFFDAVGSGLVVLHCSRNIGVGPAWNLGISYSTADYVCVMNNDILLTPDWLDHLLWPFTRDERVWCTGPIFTRVELPEDFDQLADFIGQSEPKLAAGGIVGFCFVLKRIAIERLGRFDERFETAWFEDTDYYMRLAKAGHPPAIATNCLIHHYETRTALNELPNSGTEILERNGRRFRQKWGRVVDPGTDVVYTLPFGRVTLRQPAPGMYSADAPTASESGF